MKNTLIILFIVLIYITVMFEVKIEASGNKASLHQALVHHLIISR